MKMQTSDIPDDHLSGLCLCLDLKDGGLVMVPVGTIGSFEYASHRVELRRDRLNFERSEQRNEREGPRISFELKDRKVGKPKGDVEYLEQVSQVFAGADFRPLRALRERCSDPTVIPVNRRDGRYIVLLTSGPFRFIFKPQHSPRAEPIVLSGDGEDERLQCCVGLPPFELRVAGDRFRDLLAAEDVMRRDVARVRNAANDVDVRVTPFGTEL